jgi:2'-5' RNA ligase
LPTRVAVVAYPIFAERDLAEIQAIRAIHDPQFSLLAPHFTLVFPVEANVADVIAVSKSSAATVRRFSFTLTSVRAVRDSFGPGGHVFLVPDDGAASIADLHTRLYSGVLHEARRSDIPYVPHITVAADSAFDHCEALAADLAANSPSRRGRVDALTVLGLSGNGIQELEACPLEQ